MTSFSAPTRRRAGARSVAQSAVRPQATASWRAFVMAAFAGAAALALLLSGCNNSAKTFGKINGQIVTEDEYVHQLERLNVSLPGGQSLNAGRVAVDQIVTNKIILTEASKAGVLPSEDSVNNMFNLQKKLYEQQFPGKQYEAAMKDQGTTAEEMKGDFRVQLAETAMYAKMLNLDESEVRSAYDRNKSSYGLPPRVQLRLIVASPKAPEYAKIQQGLAAKKPFEDIAKELNPPAMRPTGGLFPNVVPIQQLPPAWQTQVSQTAEGAYFGPVDFQGGTKTWVKIEKKYPEFKLSIDDALPLVRTQLVKMKLSDPKNQHLRDEVQQKKWQATFDASDKRYDDVWNAVKEFAKKATATTGQAAPPSAPSATGAVPTGAIGGAPATK